MFSQIERVNKRGAGWRTVSIAIHCLLLYVLVLPPRPLFVRPYGVMHGEHGTSTAIYLAKLGDRDLQPSAQEPLAYRAPRVNEPRIRKLKRVPPKPQQAAEVSTPRAGTPWGSLLQGPVDGHEVRPAFPLVFPDPVVPRSQIPAGVAGNIIVEITIDEQGNVVAMKVLQAIGYGIEDKVLAALRNWRFQPALMDGHAIASQQDVHFRFPS